MSTIVNTTNATDSETEAQESTYWAKYSAAIIIAVISFLSGYFSQGTNYILFSIIIGALAGGIFWFITDKASAQDALIMWGGSAGLTTLGCVIWLSHHPIVL